MKNLSIDRNDIERMSKECVAGEKPRCTSFCPLHLDIIDVIKKFKDGDIKKADKLIRDELTFPKILCRVCIQYCKSACILEEHDKAINIPDIIRYISDYKLHDMDRKIKLPQKSTGKNVAIIGGGIAGIYAAFMMRMQGHETTIFEKTNNLGGRLYYNTLNSVLPLDVLNSEISILKKIGVNVRLNVEIGKDIEFISLRNSFDAVIVTIGSELDNDRSDLHLPVDINDVYDGYELLNNIKHNNFTLDNLGDTIIIYGNNLESMQLARLCNDYRDSNIYIVSEEKLNRKGYLYDLKKTLTKNGVMFIEEDELIKVNSNNDKGGVITLYDSIKDEEYTMPYDSFIFMRDREVNMFSNSNLIMKDGFILTDTMTLETSIKGVFASGRAIGNMYTSMTLATTKRACISMSRYLNDENTKEDRNFIKESQYDSDVYVNISPESTYESSVKPKVEIRFDEKTEYNNGYDKSQALKEASRCLLCSCNQCYTNFEEEHKSLLPKYIFTDYINGQKVNKNLKTINNDIKIDSSKCPKNLDIEEALQYIKSESSWTNTSLFTTQNSKKQDSFNHELEKVFNQEEQGKIPKKSIMNIFKMKNKDK